MHSFVCFDIFITVKGKKKVIVRNAFDLLYFYQFVFYSVYHELMSVVKCPPPQ